MLGNQEIVNRFGYHKPSIVDGEDTTSKHEDLRKDFMKFARSLDYCLPEGRAKDVAMTELETVAMWAHKAVAQLSPINPDSPEVPDGFVWQEEFHLDL